MNEESIKRIVLLGAGFGGLEFCRRFRHGNARITVIDRQNHHLFQPLLYQVATAGLAMPDISEPIRSILSGRRDVEVLMEEVREIDLKAREIVLNEGRIGYDYLIIALGAVSHFFKEEWRQHALGLKNLADAMRIRATVLASFERAETIADAGQRKRFITVAVIGGGPTGVEMAGALAELTKRTFAKDYRNVRPEDVRILLIEADDRLLGGYHVALQENAARSLEKLGVELHLSSRVQEIGPGVVHLAGHEIRAETIIWTAGVRANPVTRTLGVELDKGGRIIVREDASVPGHPEVFAIGDAAHMVDADGVEAPGLAPAAMQMGAHVARLIERELESNNPNAGSEGREAFRYKDRGKMATIGRSMAVAELFGRRMSGFTAWIIWLFVHLISLIGFRNKLSVLLQWFMAYVLYRNGARILVDFERVKTFEES